MAMIIALYESNYPIVLDEEPKWQDLPVGYFQVEQWRLGRALTQEVPILYGTFVYAHGFRAHSGDHLLAAFSYKGERYL
jgi:hypothetical protein